MPEKESPAPPYHSNVVSGADVEKLVAANFRRKGVIHKFGMTWPCGHNADAEEVSNRRDCLKVCVECADKYGLR